VRSSSRVLAIFASVVIVSTATLAWLAGSELIAPAPARIPDNALSIVHEAVSFPSRSGSSIHGWYVPATKQVGAVVLMHGVRANRLEMVGRANFLHEAGYSVLLFDFQAHGESPGEHITFGHSEALDAAAAVSFVRQRSASQFVGVIGVSLGGAAAVLGTDALPVQAVILEAVYPSIDVATENRLEIRLGPMGRLLSPLLVRQLSWRLGINQSDLEPETGVRRLSAPILIIAGGADRHTTLGDSQRLYAAAPDPKSLWIIPGAAHVDFEAYSHHEYQEHVLAFLEKCRGGA